jgi:hypothetical protein
MSTTSCCGRSGTEARWRARPNHALPHHARGYLGQSLRHPIQSGDFQEEARSAGAPKQSLTMLAGSSLMVVGELGSVLEPRPRGKRAAATRNSISTARPEAMQPS